MTEMNYETSGSPVTEHNSDLHLIFGTGPAGTTLSEVLVAQNKRVRCINRSGQGVVPTEA